MSVGNSSIVLTLRAAGYMVLMMLSGLAVTVADIISYPIVRLYDPVFFTFHRWTMMCARFSLWPFGIKLKVFGRENIPKEAAILVCNHQSNLDSNLCSIGLHDVNFKCTYKAELNYYPGVGSAIWFANHIPIRRGDKNSASRLFARCKYFLQNNTFVFFFPEGTRKIEAGNGPIGPFKPGAFKLAVETGAKIVPLTISGARELMPARGLPRLGYGEPILTVHPAISPVGKTVEQLSDEVRKVMLTSMRPIDDVPAHETEETALKKSN